MFGDTDRGRQERDLRGIELCCREVVQRSLLCEHGVAEMGRTVLVERDGQSAVRVVDDQDRTVRRLLFQMGES